MNKIIKILLLLCIWSNGIAQNKSGYTWIIGGDAMYAKFNGDTIRPITGQLFSTTSFPHYPYIFTNGHSNICDSANGRLLLLSTGYVLYDTVGNIVENGDSLVPKKIYTHNSYPNSPNTQGSLILPKGSNGLYYLFTATMTDSAYTSNVTGGQSKVPYDLLQYHIVDANANGGLGKVVQKNIPLLTNVEMCKVGMMACRHANGYDWWLLKQALDTNMIYTFLVTKDTVLLDTIQGFPEPHFGYYDLVGQSCFSKDGSKYAFATGGGFLNNKGAHLFIMDFDRCTGILSNTKEIYAPYDSTLTPLDTIFGPYLDSLITGISFSANDSFLYVTRRYNVYQYEMYEPDTTLAWNMIQHGPDTTFNEFVEYGQMQRGIDNRIYIGRSFGASGVQNSVIDYPNQKGNASSFCPRCLRCDTCIDYICSPPNIPDFNLGKKEPCWPLSNNDIIRKKEEILAYPNPAITILNIEIINEKSELSKIELYNLFGQLLRSDELKTNKKLEMNISDLSNGIYYLRYDGLSKKVIKE